jgi:hypothetical protein
MLRPNRAEQPDETPRSVALATGLRTPPDIFIGAMRPPAIKRQRLRRFRGTIPDRFRHRLRLPPRIAPSPARRPDPHFREAARKRGSRVLDGTERRKDVGTRAPSLIEPTGARPSRIFCLAEVSCAALAVLRKPPGNHPAGLEAVRLRKVRTDRGCRSVAFHIIKRCFVEICGRRSRAVDASYF